jgi:hypothetical protein
MLAVVFFIAAPLKGTETIGGFDFSITVMDGRENILAT